MIELLSPVGDFECLKAAVQNGADSVYFGADIFNARAFASNFTLDELKKCITYAKLRGVKTNLTLNILLKNTELQNALNLAKSAYEFGIDAIIVQDLGLGKYLIDNFPGLAVHASTQMTTHNLDGVLLLQNLGFKRVVLARELPVSEIEYICKNSSIEIETFIHGALCISYSGQCLFSSLVGGRSGNRGKCAGPCRLPYTLKQNNRKVIDSGYLLSPRDLCGLEFIPSLRKAGVSCLKVEGRMKSPQYVATVTRIYRKYIDLAKSSAPYIIEEDDKKQLLQVFNRGNFSNGHLDNKANKKLIFKEKPNNIGLPLGNIIKYQKQKGLITTRLNESLSIGDKIAIDKESGTYTVSELMKNGKNIKEALKGEIVTLGRMKGNISINDNLYKMGSKSLFELAKNSYSKENKKVNLICDLKIQVDKPITAHVIVPDFSTKEDFIFDITPQKANNQSITTEKIEKQFSKTTDTPFCFEELNINMENDIFLPISNINQVRRKILEQIEQKIINNFQRTLTKKVHLSNPSINNCSKANVLPKISLFLQQLEMDIDYTKLENIDRLYIPLSYFMDSKYINILLNLSKTFDLYVYLPNIMRENLIKKAKEVFSNILETLSIKGVIISNISWLEFINSLTTSKRLEKIGNYTLGCLNSLSIDMLKNLHIDCFTLSPELDKNTLFNISKVTSLPTEFIVYGRLPVMTCNYCFLGKTNKCISSCDRKCTKDTRYYLQDRKNSEFPIYVSPTQTITTIYNSKITSISPDIINAYSVRIDVLEENIEEINSIISLVRSKKRKEGKMYTTNNLNREI